MIRSLAIEKLKQELTLTDEQKDILIGLLLGDACLETHNEGRTYRLKIEQSIAHQAYIEHLHNLFDGWVLTPPRIRQVVSKNRTSENLAFQTISHSAFRFFAHQFYQDGRKRVPKLIHRWLTPRAIAYWFMDDGSIKSSESKGVIFNTHAFQRADIERLIRVLQSFDLQASIRNQKEGCQIYIAGSSYERFTALIAPHIISAMGYKIPLPRRTHLPKE